MSGIVTQVVIEAATQGQPVTRVSQVVFEAAIPVIARSPATPTNAAVTQVVFEAALPIAQGRVSQVVFEAAVPVSDAPTSSPVSGFGFST